MTLQLAIYLQHTPLTGFLPGFFQGGTKSIVMLFFIVFGGNFAGGVGGGLLSHLVEESQFNTASTCLN